MPVGSAIASIIGSVVAVAGTVASGAAQASTTGAANTQQRNMYMEGVEYQKQRDTVADAQWRKEFGLKKRELDIGEANARWQRRQASRQIKNEHIKELGESLTRLSIEDPSVSAGLWNMWAGGGGGPRNV